MNAVMEVIDSVELAEQALKADGVTASTLGQFAFSECVYALAALIEKLRAYVNHPRITRSSLGSTSEYSIRSGMLVLAEEPTAKAAWEHACRDFTPRH